MLDSYKKTLDSFVGPAEIFICGNTLQVKDYSRYNWTMFDPEAKKKYHDETFNDFLKRAYEAGQKLCGTDSADERMITYVTNL